MDEPNFEKIGAVIFGMHRLDMVMTGLTAWMANKPAAENEPFTPTKVKAFAAIGHEFFQKQSDDTSARKFDMVIDHLQLISVMNESMKAGQPLRVDEAANACNDAHQLIAQIIETVGYSGVLPPAFMSERIIKDQ